MHEQYWVFRREPTELIVRRIAGNVRIRSVDPLFLMPTMPDDPFTRRCLTRRVGNLSNDLVPCRGPFQVEHHSRLAESREMTMPFDESWYCKFASQVDDFRLRA